MDQSRKSPQTSSMTTDELRAWLRAWVVSTTGLPEEDITDDKPMETFGLSSRDVVVLSGELENLLHVQLDATIAYEYPTIGALAKRLIDGPATSARATAQARTGRQRRRYPGCARHCHCWHGGALPRREQYQ